MKVLMINSVCGIRSTGRICTDLAQALEAQGHTVRIAYGRETVPERFSRYAVRIGSDCGVKLHALKARAFDASGFGSRFATLRFLDWVRKYDPDVIHLHNIHGYYLHVGLLFDYLRTCGKRILWTLHDTWSFSGHSPFCGENDCRRWETGCYSCPQRCSYPKSLTDGSARNWRKKRVLTEALPSLTLVSPSAWLAEMVRASFLSGYEIHVIPNGVDTRIFHPTLGTFRSDYGIGNDRILLAVSTVWDQKKGLDDYCLLAKRLPEGFRLVLVGVPDGVRASLPPETIALPVTESAAELASIYTEAEILLNLSYSENYPTVNLEAMCCGTPVLTYDTGGSAESVRALGGIVTRKGDLDAVLQLIQTHAYRPLSEAEYSFAQKQFDCQTTVQAYLSLYR